MFLTQDEVQELTQRQRRDAQRRVLVQMGISHKVRPDGSLAVLKAHVEKVFDGKLASAKLAAEPDWDALS